MKKNLMIPAGQLAGDLSADEIKKRNEDLKNRLLSGKKVIVNQNGNVTNTGGNDSGMQIPIGKLANDLSTEEIKKRNEELRRKLLEGGKVTINHDGSVTGDSKEGMQIPAGKLAAIQQWYDKNPNLLSAEMEAMSKYFPHFLLDKMSDGKLCWTGSLNVGIIGDNKWKVRAIYQNNHPHQEMGSSVHVYLIEPSIEYVIKCLGWTPHHLISDGKGGLYLCTAQSSDIHACAAKTTTAASVLGWAVKWLMSLELVLDGTMTRAEFNTPGVV